MTLFLRFVLAAAAMIASGGCRQAAVTKPPVSPLHFTRATSEAGIRFRHQDGSSGRKYFPEVMGPGCAFADLTGDGLPDVYLVNGAPLPGAPAAAGYGNRFYRNDGNGTFTDVTDAAGLKDGGYGVGCCAGDFDNDGHLDLYVTHVGRNTLYRNQGDGTFRDVTARAGVGAAGFSTAACFGDYDNDGFLDLYVSRYVVWSPDRNKDCYAPAGDRRVLVYCRPIVYPAAAGVLYHNNRNGTFTDSTRAAGLAVQPGRGLGALWTDVNGDGKQDLFVANDMSSNFLFVNQGNGRFREEALTRGVALSDSGHPQASMGVQAVDYDEDGKMDLACTNFSGEYLALWKNTGDGHFEDVSSRAGLVEATQPFVGFGLAFADLNLDGWPDLLVANGHVTEAAEQFYPGVTFAQPTLCLLNDGAGRFVPVADPGAALTKPRVSRGAAFADYDRDGDLDVLISNWRNEPDLLRNDTTGAGHWLRLTLEGARCNRSAIGARVEVTTGRRTQVQEVRSGGSYCSQSELALTFGLGPAGAADSVRVRWPGGGQDVRRGLQAGQEYRLKQRDVLYH